MAKKPSVGMRAARRVSADVWRGARSPEPWRVHGLNSDVAVRRRLAWSADRLRQDPATPAPVRARLAALAWRDAPTGDVAAAVAELIDPLTDLTPGWVRALLRMVVVQHVGARLGWWPAGDAEADDHRVARALVAATDGHASVSLVEALQQARARHLEGRTDLALRFWLIADRLHRTPMPLLNVAALLCQLGRIREAAWALRAALLEPADQFPAPAVYGKARLLAAEIGLILAAKTETTRGSLTEAPEDKGKLDPVTLTFAPTEPPEASPMTRPLPELSELFFFEGKTAPLAEGATFARWLSASSATEPLVPAFTGAVPRDPMSPPEPVPLPDLGPAAPQRRAEAVRRSATR